MRKANSNVKRMTLASRALLKNFAIVFTLGEKATFVHRKTKRIIPACKTMVVAASEIQHPWSVYTAVMLENQLGESCERGLGGCSKRCGIDRERSGRVVGSFTLLGRLPTR